MLNKGENTKNANPISPLQRADNSHLRLAKCVADEDVGSC